MQDQIGQTVAKALEQPAWAIFAVIIVGKALDFGYKVLVERKRSSNNPAPRQSCVDSAKWAIHDKTQTDLCEAVKEMAESTVASNVLLGKIADSAERQEQSLNKIATDGR